jgi:hypothetical protein
MFALRALLLLALIAVAHSFFNIFNVMGNGGSKLAASGYPIKCDETVMAPKAHGTCEKPVMKNLRWNCDWSVADRICCFNRHYAEVSAEYCYCLCLLSICN